MKIIEYKIPSQIYVKAEITKLIALPINNSSDNYYMIIPSVISTLPDNVMFIQETLLVPPHSVVNYIPKIVKLGVTLSQSLPTKLTKGIDIRLLVIDNINNLSITGNDVVKKVQAKSNKIENNYNKDNIFVSDGVKVVVDDQRKQLLGAIDEVIVNNEMAVESLNNKNNNISQQPIVKEVNLEVDKLNTLNDNNNVINNNNEEDNLIYNNE